MTTMSKNPPKEENVVLIEEIGDHLPGLEYNDPNSEETEKEPSFILKFWKTPGCLPLLCVTFLIGASIGMTVSMIPEVMSDRYARINHGYGGEPCKNLPYDEKPEECRLGGVHAQNVAAWSSSIQNIVCFFFRPVVGSMSDVTGRRKFLLIGVGLCILPQIALVMLQLIKTMNPLWFYISFCLVGLVGWLPIAFAALSDIMPRECRATSFALVLGSFYASLSVTPYIATTLSHHLTSIISLAVALITFFYAFSFVPETLSYQISGDYEAAIRRDSEDDVKHNFFLKALSRPFHDLSILNRNKFFRLVSGVAFLTGFAYSTDEVLTLYYLENHRNFTDSDVSLFLLLNGAFGILVNFFLLKQFIGCFGEKYVLIAAIAFGSVHNLLYGIANQKTLVYIAVSLSSLTGMSYPIVASMESYNCAEYEQGRVQGTFASLASLARAAGPSLMTIVYKHTKDKVFFGPGTMFLVVSFLNAFAIIFAFAIPSENANSKKKNRATDLNQLLLDDDSASVDSRVEFF